VLPVRRTQGSLKPATTMPVAPLDVRAVPAQANDMTDDAPSLSGVEPAVDKPEEMASRRQRA